MMITESRQWTLCSAGSRGFSLVEMAVSLAVIGLLVGIGAQLLSDYRQRTDTQRQENLAQTRTIERAIHGFVQANSRLPCPDISRDGLEQCNDATGARLAAGYLPYKTLQLYQEPERSWAAEVAYAAYRATDADTAVLQQKYSTVGDNHASACSGSDSTACTVDQATAAIPTATTSGYDLRYSMSSSSLNLLDFCTVLGDAAAKAPAADQLHVQVSGNVVNVAYAFALPGSPRLLDTATGLLESRPDIIDPTFAGTQTSPANSDDLSRIVSFNQVYQDYDCPDRLTAARALYHRDVALIGDEYLHRVHLADARLMKTLADKLDNSSTFASYIAGFMVAKATFELAASISSALKGNAIAIAKTVINAVTLAQSVTASVIAANQDAAAYQAAQRTQRHYENFQQNLLNSGNEMTRWRDMDLAAEQRGSW